jgi:hypothetical protein
MGSKAMEPPMMALKCIQLAQGLTIVKAKTMDQRSDSLVDIALGHLIKILRAVVKFHDD